MNELVHLAEFRSILDSYKLSAESKKILTQTKLALMLAPTSSGRNTIIKKLVAAGDYEFIVSDTTRKPRINNGVLEKSGVEYWFRDEADMLADLKVGKLLEAEIIHKGWVSGISMREIKKATDHHKIAITDIDLVGTQNILEAKKDTVPILVLPPNFEEWQKRIAGRGEMHEREFQRRLETACTIFKEALSTDYLLFVINDDLAEAVAYTDQVVKSGPDSDKQAAGRELVARLLQQTEEFLATKQI